MKNFLLFLENDPSSASLPVEQQDIFKNPAYRFLNFEQALNAAQNMVSKYMNPFDRIYVLKYSKGFNPNIDKEKPFLVVYNKMLIAQAPDWQDRGYTIVAWVSTQDGLVLRDADGNYSKPK